MSSCHPIYLAIMSLLFDFVLSLGVLIPRSILEIDCMGCSCSYGGQEFIPDLPRGGSTLACFWGLSPKGSVVTGRGLSRGVPEGLDWRFQFKEALDEMHVVLTRLARTTTRMQAIGLVMPSVMLYPYRCSWMRSTFVHHSYISKVYSIYAIHASCQDRSVRLDEKPWVVLCQSTD